MKRLFFILSLIIQNAHSQQPYWQQQVNYSIDVKLDDKEQALEAFIQMDYVNNSPDTLNYIWFHLWPNAYKNENTALAKQLGSGKLTGRNLRGYIDKLDFRTNGIKLVMEPHPMHEDIIRLILNKSLLPGTSIEISTPFRVKLPVYFSRSGHFGNQYIICQWYPKPAVYDRKGWHPMPYLERGEFYSEFGKFQVTISLPSAYVVGATGTLLTRHESDMYKKIGSKNLQEKESGIRYKPMVPDSVKSLQYFADSVHDFAWFADKDFIIRYDTLMQNGSVVDVYSFAQPNGNEQWKESIGFIKDAVMKYSDWIGPYPYPVVAAVEGPANARSAGMEYPMITLITNPNATREFLDAVITHEVGHNWFYGILASNERMHPWMDEGMNSYYQFKYEAEKYRWNSILKNFSDKLKALSGEEFLFQVLHYMNRLPAKAPITTPSSGFRDMATYGSVAYMKTAVWMGIVEASLGKENFRHAIRSYYEEWKFKHPYPEDLQASMEKTLKLGLNGLFDLLQKKGNFK